MKRTFAAVSAAAVVLAFAASPGVAHANGRFPESNQLFFAPSDPQFLFLRTTFGFLASKDRGVTWDWVCEQSIPLSGAEDPMVSITPAGTLLATTFQGLGISRTNACDWSFFGGELAQQVFIDLAADPSNPSNVAVFASSYDRQDEAGNILFTSRIWETKDEGQTFTRMGGPIDPALLGYTLDLTKTDPNRLYLSALRDPGVQPRALFLASSDRGNTYAETEIPLVETERGIFIAAVDPTNADRVYLRTSNAAVDRPGRLLLSDDAGKTWRTVYTGAGGLLGFALSEDGKTVWVGGPKDGVRQASTADFVFTQKSNIEVQCLAKSSDGLWACSNEKSGFIIGVSTDEGVTFEKRTRFCDIRGPLACPAGTKVAVECPISWPSQQSLLGCGDGPDGGGSGADGGGLGSQGEPPVEQLDPAGGFDCRTSRTSPFAALGSAAAAILGIAVAFRRGRRR